MSSIFCFSPSYNYRILVFLIIFQVQYFLMKKPLFAAQVILYLCFSIFFFFTILEWTNTDSPFNHNVHSESNYNGLEEYNPGLSRLNSVDKLVAYCDSLFNDRQIKNSNFQFSDGYPIIASEVIRNRFYHGYSSYSMQNNFAALLLEPLTGKWMSAIVLPEDIVKYPYAACSQQSIVMMELLERKGYETRKVTFNSKTNRGHFAFEVKYNDGWHFFDPNMEPDLAVLIPKGMPSIKELMNESDKATILSAYHHLPLPQVLGIFDQYAYGKINTFPAPYAFIYQKSTKVLSNIAWLFFLLASIFVRRRYLHLVRNPIHVRNYRIYFPKITGRRAPAYYPDYSA